MQRHDADLDRVDAERVLAGEEGAFAGIVERWQGPLVNLAYRYCRHRGRAEEMAQEAFLRIFRGLGSWRGDSAFSTWIYSIATNTYRSEMRRGALPEVEWSARADSRESTSANDDVESADRDAAVRRSVAALPAKYRDAVVLYYFHDMDVAGASRTLGIPEGTLKARLHRGRALLERKLAGLFASRRTAEAR